MLFFIIQLYILFAGNLNKTEINLNLTSFEYLYFIIILEELINLMRVFNYELIK